MNHKSLIKEATLILLVSVMLMAQPVPASSTNGMNQTPKKSYIFRTDYQTLNSSLESIEVTFYDQGLADRFRDMIKENPELIKNVLMKTIDVKKGATISDLKITYIGLDSPGEPLKVTVTFKQEGPLFRETVDGVYYADGRLMSSSVEVKVEYYVTLPPGYSAKHVTPKADLTIEDGRTCLKWEVKSGKTEQYYFELTKIKVRNLKLYRKTHDTINFEETKTFTVHDEYVVASVEVLDGTKTDELRWVFTGPNNIRYEDSYMLRKEGNDFYGCTLILKNYCQHCIVGSWTVTLYVNGLKALETQFTVEEAPAQSLIRIVDHALCKNVENGEPVDVTSTFTSGDVVYCWLKIQDGRVGDHVYWLYTGPFTANASYFLEWNGDGICYSTFDLSVYDPETVVGEWTVTVYVNGKEVLTDHFKVEEQPKSWPCIIATATYGSELADEVQFLRGFRDNLVMSTFAGSRFMRVFNAWYYSFSPAVAGFIAQQPILKAAMKIILYPLIGILHLSSSTYGVFSLYPELGVVIAGLVASSLIGIVYFSIPLMALWRITKKYRRKLSKLRLFKIMVALWMASVVTIIVGEVAHSSFIMMSSTALFVLSTISLAVAFLYRIFQPFFAKVSKRIEV